MDDPISLTGIRVVFEDGAEIELEVTDESRHLLINQFLGRDLTFDDFVCIPHYIGDVLHERMFVCLRDSIKYLA